MNHKGVCETEIPPGKRYGHWHTIPKKKLEQPRNQPSPDPNPKIIPGRQNISIFLAAILASFMTFDPLAVRAQNLVPTLLVL